MERIDDLIDSPEVAIAASRGITLHSFISRSEKHRKACTRAFGNVRKALEEYGYYEEMTEINHQQLLEIIVPLMSLDEKDAPFLPVDEKDRLCELYTIDAELLRSCINHAKDLKRLQIIERYVDSGGCIMSLFDNESRPVSSGLNYAAYKLFGSSKELCRHFGISHELVSMRENHLLFWGQAGRDFEKAVLEVFEVYGVSVIYNRQQAEGCRPDFVLSDRWADTKLSKSTIFSAADKALEKYLEHTDKLDIIYAIDDVSDEELPELPVGVRLVNVFDYFDEIPTNIKSELNRIIQEANDKRTKRRRRWAV